MWDATPVVTHPYAQVVLDVYLDALTGVHFKLVDRVVDDLLEQHVDAVLGQCTVAQATDVHARACADVLDA